MTNLVAELRFMCTTNLETNLERIYSLLISAAEEIEVQRSALKVAQQAILEFSHAQECGPSWYTRGENGMYQQVNLWLRRGLKAVQDALGPYDDNGQYLKESYTPESVVPVSSPTDTTNVHTYDIANRPRIFPCNSDRIRGVWVSDGKLCLIIEPEYKAYTGYSG